MKIEEYKKINKVCNLIQVFLLCEKNKTSLKEITFDFLNDFEKHHEEQIVELINIAKCEKFKYEALFILANKMNNPSEVKELKNIHLIRMVFAQNVKDVNKDFLYKDEEFVKKVNNSILESNSLIKEQYLHFLSPRSNKREKEASIIQLKEMFEGQEEKFPKEVDRVKKYLENIIINNKLETPNIIERRNLWIEIFKKDSSSPKLKIK